jgi:hypothetical protein
MDLRTFLSKQARMTSAHKNKPLSNAAYLRVSFICAGVGGFPLIGMRR